MKQYKIYFCLSVTLLFTYSDLYAENDYHDAYERKAIAQVKATPASDIDPCLPPISYEKWFRSLAGNGAKIKWDFNDCGEGTGNSSDNGSDMSLCVGSTAKLVDGREIFANVEFARSSEKHRGYFPKKVEFRSQAGSYKERPLTSGTSPLDLQNFLNIRIIDIKLLYAAAWSDTETARVLLKQGANVNFELYKTPLLEAASIGSVPFVALLLEFGADVNARDEGGDIALNYAASNKQLDVVNMLLKNGVDSYSKNRTLSFAASDGYVDMVDLLLKNGVDKEAKNDALESAAEYGHLAITKLLIMNGADVNIKDKKSWTMLMHAASKGNVEIMRALIEGGADINIHTGGYGPALILAAQEGHLGAVQLLIEKGADLHALTAQSDTALSIAIKRQHLDIVKVLEEAEGLEKKN